MNEKLKKIRDELGIQHAKNIGVSDVIFNTTYTAHESFKQGFTAAEPHIRRDERERVLKYFNQPEFAVHKAWLEWLEGGLKKMDEAHDAPETLEIIEEIIHGK